MVSATIRRPSPSPPVDVPGTDGYANGREARTEGMVHELAITNEILRVVVKHARREKAERVHRVALVVSELSDLQPIWIQRYFDRISEGTVAHGARLEIEHQAPEFLCNRSGCGLRFAVSLRTVDRVTCPRCGGGDCTMKEPADYVVEEIEVS